MIYLLLSILSSSLLLIFFKLFEKYQIETIKAISINYLIATLLAFIFLPNKLLVIHEDAYQLNILFPILLGALFFIVFNFCNLSTRSAGIGMTSVAMKLALIFPIVFGIFIYKEPTNLFQVVGIILALIALVLLTYQKSESQVTKNWSSYIVVLVWVGSGVCDSILQFVNRTFLHLVQSGFFTLITFLSAFLMSVIYLLKINNLRYDKRSIVGGVLLGIPNYFSIYFLLKTLAHLSQYYNLTSATIFTLNNILIILFSVIIGFIFFKEKITIRKVIGFIIALLSIILITL